MSIFSDLWRWIFGGEDEHDSNSASHVQHRTQTRSYELSQPPFPPSKPVSSPCNPSSSSLRPPFPPSEPVSSPSNPSSSSLRPPFPPCKPVSSPCNPSSSSLRPPFPPSKPVSSPCNPSSSSLRPPFPPCKPVSSPSNPSSSSLRPPFPPCKPVSSPSNPSKPVSSPSNPSKPVSAPPNPSSSSPKAYTSLFKPPESSSLNASSPFSPNPPPVCASKPSPSPPSGPAVSSTKLHPTFKPVLSRASSNVLDQKGKKSYVWIENDSLPVFAIPDDIQDLIKNGITPKVLNRPLSPATYKDYFAALLYAEELYYEKWPHFELENVPVELQEAAIFKNQDKEEKTLVAFDMASFPSDRPFLLSRDLVSVRPSGTKAEPFQGFIYRVVKSSVVLAEFEDDFYVNHDSAQKYDVSFSFNRVCLKRAHQAVQNASEALFRNFLFPECVSRASIPTAPAQLCTGHKLKPYKLSAVRRILSIRGSPPYLLDGQLCVARSYFELSRTGLVVSEAVHQLCQTSQANRMLICAPSNRCCDGLMRSLLKWIPESDMFRANAAFREIDEVPEDILPSCLYKEPYFSCPPTEELCKFRVIFSTYMSSFRLHDKGLTAGHFSHIFLVDASSAIEPETMVALTSFADRNTTVIVTGEQGNSSSWIRADIGRKKGLKISFFERLSKSEPYNIEDSVQCSSHNRSIIKDSRV